MVLLSYRAKTKSFWGINWHNPNGWLIWEKDGSWNQGAEHQLDLVKEVKK